jgi:tetratricopeptide (TPR) repeat protein
VNAQNAQHLFAKANDEFLIGNYTSAINYCNKALEKNKSLNDVNFIAGLSYYNLKDTANALIYFNNEIQINKTDYRSYLYKAKLTTANYKLANDDLTLALKIQPTNFLLYFEKGNLNYYHLNYGMAIEDYTKAITLRPNLDEAYYKLGFCKLRLADTTSACINWHKIAELDDFKEFDLIETICKKHN